MTDMQNDEAMGDKADCGHPNPIWFADNELWNAVMGGKAAKDDPGGVLCPTCFMLKAGEILRVSRPAVSAKLPDHAKRFLAYMCAYHRAYVGQGGVSLQSEAANDSIDEIMELVPQEFHDLDFYIPDFGGCDGPWKCFHCNALFEDRDAAMQHFGESEDAVAACLVERAPKADSALAGEPDRNQPHPLSQIWADACHAWENGSHWDACETLRAALSDRDVVLEGLLREAHEMLAWCGGILDEDTKSPADLAARIDAALKGGVDD